MKSAEFRVREKIPLIPAAIVMNKALKSVIVVPFVRDLIERFGVNVSGMAQLIQRNCFGVRILITGEKPQFIFDDGSA